MAELRIDVKSTGISKTTKEVKQLDKETSTLTKTNKSLTSSFVKVAGAVGSAVIVYKSLETVYDGVIKRGLEYNKAIEQQTQSLTALIVASTKNVDSLGNALTIQQKYTLAQKQAVTTTRELAEVNKATSLNLEQTTKVYSTLLPTLGKVGASQEELLNLTKSLANASSAANIEFNSLLAGVDGLATGTVLANSDLGRFLTTLGLSNKELKESEDIVDLLTQRLAPFSTALDTLAVAQSNLGVAWDTLTGKLTKDIFFTQKESIKSLTELINEITNSKADMEAITNVINNMASGVVSSLSVVIRFINALNIMYEEIATGFENTVSRVEIGLATLEAKSLNAARGVKSAFGLDTRELESGIDVANAKIRQLKKSIEDNNTEFEKFRFEALTFNDVILNTESKLKDILFTQKDITKELTNQVSTLGEFNNLTRESGSLVPDEDESLSDTVDEQLSTSLDSWIDYYKSIGDLSTAWLIKEAKLKEKFIDLDEKQFKKLSKIKEKEFKETGDNEKENQKKLISGYGQLAGAIAGAFEEGSKAQKAFLIGQQLAALTSAVDAVLTQGKGDPYTAPARIAAMIATVTPLLGIAGIAFGGSGGGGGESSQTTLEADKDLYEADTELITDRLDRQISILESIDRQGSESVLKQDLAQVTFERTLGALTFDVGSQRVVAERTEQVRRDTVASLVEGFTGANIGQVTRGQDGQVTSAILDTSALAQNLESTVSFIKYLNDNPIDFQYVDRLSEEDIANWINEAQQAVSEYALSIIDISSEIEDAGETLKTVFDDITGTTTFQTQELNKAFEEFDNLRGQNSYANFLEEQINAINEVQALYTDDIIDTLISQDFNDIQTQAKIIDDLRAKTNLALTGGLEDTLNLIESISLVGDAISTSNDNIKKFVDNFKTQDELLEDIANSIGEDVVDNFEELEDVFVRLATDTQGLTDAESEYLDASIDSINRIKDERIEALNEELSVVRSNINTVESVLKSLDNVTNKLKGDTLGGDFTLDRFFNSLSETVELSKGSDYKALSDSIRQTVSFSSALTGSNFGSREDFDFARLTAVNEFEAIEVTLEDELDILKQIEENTKNTVTALEAQLFNLSSSIDNLTEAQTITEPTTRRTTGFSSITDIYQSVLGRSPESADVINAWVNLASETSLDFVASQISQSTEAQLKGIQGFSSGGYTGMGRTDQIAGFVHKDEYVVNSDQLRQVGGVNALESMLAGNTQIVNQTTNSSGYMRQMVIEIQALKKGFQQLSSGWDKMSVSLDA